MGENTRNYKEYTLLKMIVGFIDQEWKIDGYLSLQ